MSTEPIATMDDDELAQFPAHLLSVELHEVHDAGYEANHDGALLSANPHAAGSLEFFAWKSGHLSAQFLRDEWENMHAA